MSKKENIEDVITGSSEEREVLTALSASYLDRQFDSKWKPSKIQQIKNNRVEGEYEDKKQDFLVRGRKGSELEEAWGFLVDNNVAAINVVANLGLQAKESEYNALGYNRMGVYLCRHADVCLQHALVKHSGSAVMRMVICKFVAGRPTTAIPRVASASEFIEPTQGFDCHESVIAPNMKDSLQNKFDRSQVYLYEINKVLQPSLRPRQILPYAIIHFTLDGVYVPAIDAEPTPAEVAASQVTLIPTKLTQKAIPEPAPVPMSSPGEQPGSTSSTPQSVKNNGTGQSESPVPSEPSKSSWRPSHPHQHYSRRPPTPRTMLTPQHQLQQLQQQLMIPGGAGGMIPGGGGGMGLMPGIMQQPRGIPPGYALLTANGQVIYGGGGAPAPQVPAPQPTAQLVQLPGGGYAYAMMPQSAPAAVAPGQAAYLQAMQPGAGLAMKPQGLQAAGLQGLQMGLPASVAGMGYYGALPGSLAAARSQTALGGSRPITPEIPTAGYVANNISGYTPAMLQASTQPGTLGVGGQPIPVIANGSVSAAQTQATSYVQQTPAGATSYYLTPSGAIAAAPAAPQGQLTAGAMAANQAQAYQQLGGISYINPYAQQQILQQQPAMQKVAYASIPQFAQAGLVQTPAGAVPIQGLAMAPTLKRPLGGEAQAVISDKRLRLQ